MGRVVMSAVALAALAACSDPRRRNDVDSSLSRDLQLVGQVSAQPTFQDTALNAVAANVPAAQPDTRRTSAPAARRDQSLRPALVPVTPPRQQEAPAPAVAPAPAPAAREIAAGTGISMTSGGRVCSTTNRPGDKIVATIDAPVTGSNGALIPAGSKAVLEVASVIPGQSPEQNEIVFRVRALYVGDSSYQVAGDVMPTSNLEKAKIAGDPNSDKKKVIGGAIAGAIIGQMMGHNTKSTVIGAATGAAAGAVASKAGEKYEGCLRAGATLRLTLGQALVM